MFLSRYTAAHPCYRILAKYLRKDRNKRDIRINLHTLMELCYVV